MDLPARVLDAIGTGMSRRVAGRFEISEGTAVRWTALVRDRGSAA
jgi:transposase